MLPKKQLSFDEMKSLVIDELKKTDPVIVDGLSIEDVSRNRLISAWDVAIMCNERVASYRNTSQVRIKKNQSSAKNLLRVFDD